MALVSWSWEGIAAALWLLLAPCHQPGFTDRYDAAIRRAVAHHWPVEARAYWCRLKAQLVEESSLAPTARSRVGAQGIAQFMPGTWRDAVAGAGLSPDASPYDARAAIRGAAWYTAWLRGRWTEPRSERCRQNLATASYNAGLGSILAAQRRSRAAGRPGICWPDLRGHLPAVTGPGHSAETCRYVARVSARSVRQPPPPRAPCRTP